MYDLNPFERLMWNDSWNTSGHGNQDKQKLPKDLYPFRNYIRGPQQRMFPHWVHFEMSWHPLETDFWFSVTPTLTVWDVIQYFSELEPDMHFTAAATDLKGNPVNAAAKLSGVERCYISKEQNKPTNQPDGFPYDPPNTRFMWCQTDINMQQRNDPQEVKLVPASPPGLQQPVQPAQAGCMTSSFHVFIY